MNGWVARRPRGRTAIAYALTGIYLRRNIRSVQQTFAALAEPNRLRIVELLRTGARPVAEIGERLHLQQPQVSKHLRVLRDAGLVAAEVRAQQRLYQLEPKTFREMDRWLERFRDLWDARLDRLESYVEQMKKARSKTTSKK
jgi:DNA-binding transcriptional ArsR family regulator